MPSLADALRDPIELASNPIPRFYRGGRLLGTFRGDERAVDDDRPEDWVGSATRTWARPGAGPSTLGLSPVAVGGELMTMDELLAREPEALIGSAMLERAGPTLGLLVKLLDAGQRLPVHCHPSRRAARRLLGSQFGKTEAWLVLAIREEEPEARVWAGFREDVRPTTLRRWIAEQASDALLQSLVEHAVRPGDVILVPAGTPHAIGAGLFLLELQEPTDYSVVAETRGYPITDADATLGLGWDTAIGFFDTAAAAELRQIPRRISDGVTRLTGPDADPFFRAYRLDVSGEMSLPVEPSFAIGIVLSGAGTLSGATTSLTLGPGTTVALPAASAADVRLRSAGMTLVLCLPPEPRLAPAR